MRQYFPRAVARFDSRDDSVSDSQITGCRASPSLGRPQQSRCDRLRNVCRNGSEPTEDRRRVAVTLAKLSGSGHSGRAGLRPCGFPSRAPLPGAERLCQTCDEGRLDRLRRQNDRRTRPITQTREAIRCDGLARLRRRTGTEQIARMGCDSASPPGYQRPVTGHLSTPTYAVQTGG